MAGTSMTVITMARAAATFGSAESMKRPAEYKGLGSTRSLVKRGGDIVAVSRVSLYRPWSAATVHVVIPKAVCRVPHQK